MNIQLDARRYQFLRDFFALNAESDEQKFAELAKLSGKEFDEAVDKEMNEFIKEAA